MAGTGRRADTALSERLLTEAHRFGFFQAVRLLQAFASRRVRVGEAGPIGHETVRFAAEPSLAFPASEVLDITDEPAGGPARMVVRFMGLTGPQGTLPTHYTELLVERLRRKDSALVDFLDLFNHRLVSLFFRAWEKYRPHLRVTPEARDELSIGLFSFFGLGTAGLRGRLAVRDRSLLFYAGLLAQRPRSAVGLQALVGDYFGGIPARIDQFVGQWLWLDPESLTKLVPFGGNNRLGVDAVLGERVWHTQSKFRVRLGPMTYARLCTFLPSGAASREVLDLTRFYVGLDLDFEFQLALRADEVVSTQLGSTGPEATRLGWSSWLCARRHERDADDVVFTAQALMAYHAQMQTRGDAA
jgi:type VI secretion system protein ImpH